MEILITKEELAHIVAEHLYSKSNSYPDGLQLQIIWDTTDNDNWYALVAEKHEGESTAPTLEIVK